MTPLAKKAAATKKAAPVKKVVATKKAAPVKKVAPAVKAVATKNAAPATKATVVTKKTVKKIAPEAPKVSPYAKDVKFIAKITAEIAEERKAKAAQREDLIAQADEIISETGPREVQFDDESGEGAGAAVDREFSLYQADKLLEEIFELDEALRRIKAKRYGLCERCHKPILKARLEAIPYARLDTNCVNPPLVSRF